MRSIAVMICSSDSVDPDEIQEIMSVKAQRVIWKNLIAETHSTDLHPYHFAFYESDVEEAKPVEMHIEAIVRLMEGWNDSLNRLAEKGCAVAVHCHYELGTNGCLHFKPALLKRMGKANCEFVINISDTWESKR